jgi:hypothetical protein
MGRRLFGRDGRIVHWGQRRGAKNKWDKKGMKKGK